MKDSSMNAINELVKREIDDFLGDNVVSEKQRKLMEVLMTRHCLKVADDFVKDSLRELIE